MTRLRLVGTDILSSGTRFFMVHQLTAKPVPVQSRRPRLMPGAEAAASAASLPSPAGGGQVPDVRENLPSLVRANTMNEWLSDSGTALM
jgi:hypothetical protein